MLLKAEQTQIRQLLLELSEQGLLCLLREIWNKPNSVQPGNATSIDHCRDQGAPEYRFPHDKKSTNNVKPRGFSRSTQLSIKFVMLINSIYHADKC